MSFQFFFPVVCWGLFHCGSFVGLASYVSFVTASIYHFSVVFFLLSSLSFPGGFLANKPAVCICFAHPTNPSDAFQSLLMVCVKGLFGDQVSDTLFWGFFCTLPPNSFSRVCGIFHASISLSVGSCGTRNVIGLQSNITGVDSITEW